MYPNIYYEKKLWNRGFKFIAGVDEVGRGCFAGPVVAAAVVFVKNSIFQLPILTKTNEKIFINDSKKLTEKRREASEKWIKENAVTWGTGEASVAEINRLGMGKATKTTFRRAVANANIRLHKKIEYLLVDAFYIPYISGFPKGNNKGIKGSKKPNINDSKSKQLAIINGDEKSISIAAASIVAKVYRDNLMIKIGKRNQYKIYDWPQNKGYASKTHRQAILKHGITKHHRKQFVDTFLRKKNLT